MENVNNVIIHIITGPIKLLCAIAITEYIMRAINMGIHTMANQTSLVCSARGDELIMIGKLGSEYLVLFGATGCLCTGFGGVGIIMGWEHSGQGTVSPAPLSSTSRWFPQDGQLKLISDMCFLLSLVSNVRGQRTRHLVTGTLHPLVGLLDLISVLVLGL